MRLALVVVACVLAACQNHARRSTKPDVHADVGSTRPDVHADVGAGGGANPRIGPERVNAAMALAPIDQRTAFGKAVMLFDGVPRAQLDALGETRNPSVADIFVATMKGSYA